MERLIDQERAAANRGDPEDTAKAWADKVAECARLRSAYQDQRAADLMTLEELGEKLSEIDETAGTPSGSSPRSGTTGSASKGSRRTGTL